jgi:O-antigen/teichoic acid export membrane protein
MSLAKKIAQNTAWLYGAEVISKVFQVVLVIILARKYGADIFGQYSFAMSFTLIFAMFADLGITPFIIREISRNKKLVSTYINNLLFIKALLGVLSFVLIFAIINLLGYPADVKLLVYSFGAYNILFQLLEFVKSFFKAYELMYLDSVIKITEKVITTVLALFLVYYGYPLLYVSYAFLLSMLVSIVVAFFMFRRRIFRAGGSAISRSLIKRILYKNLPFTLILIFSTIYFRIDVVLVNKLLGSAQTGIYTSAMQIVEVFMFIGIFIGVAVFPPLSRSYKTNRQRFWNIYEKILKGLLIAGVPIVMLIWMWGDRFILFLFGGEYSSAGIVLKFLVVFLFFNFFSTLNNYMMVAMDKEKSFARILAVVLILNSIANLVLIKYYDVSGAAFAKVLFEAVYLVGTVVIIGYRIQKEFAVILIKTVLAAMIPYFLFSFIVQLNLFLMLPLAILAYSVLIFLFRVISEDDILLIKEVFNISNAKGAR